MARTEKKTTTRLIEEADEKTAAALRASVDGVLQTDTGRYLMRYLFANCGFARSSLAVGKDGRIDLEGTTWNEARRDVYVRLRKYATPALLAAVEFEAEAAIAAQEAVKKETTT